MKPYRFLLDRDVSKAVSLFPARRTRTVAEVGLAENAKDAAIVEKATKVKNITISLKNSSRGLAYQSKQTEKSRGGPPSS